MGIPSEFAQQGLQGGDSLRVCPARSPGRGFPQSLSRKVSRAGIPSEFVQEGLQGGDVVGEPLPSAHAGSDPPGLGARVEGVTRH